MPVFFPNPADSKKHGVGLTIRSDQTGTNIYTTGSGMANIELPASKEFSLCYSIQLSVSPGTYFAETYLWKKGNPQYIDVGIPRYLQVIEGVPFIGNVQMDARISIL